MILHADNLAGSCIIFWPDIMVWWLIANAPWVLVAFRVILDDYILAIHVTC
jgi:hypothetical protein